MSKRDSVRQQRRREKQRKRRADAQQRRAASRPVRAAGADEPGDLSGWPVADAFLSEHWHEQGPVLHAAVVRRGPDGGVAAALLQLDLREGGVRAARTLVGVPEAAVTAELARRSEADGHAIVSVEPALVAHAVQVARSLAPTLPPGADAALRLLDGIDPSASPFQLQAGAEAAPAAPQPEASPGFFARWFGGGTR